MAKLHEEVIQIITDVVDNAIINEADYDTILKELGVDSLDMFNILLGFEEKFAIEIPTEDIDELNTVNAIVSYIEKKSN